MIMMVMMLCVSSCMVELDEPVVPGDTGGQKDWEKLQEYVSNVNDEINSLQRMVDALEGSSLIKDVSDEGDVIVITFTDERAPVYINKGETGDPLAANAPVISVRLSEGAYYWTVDNEFLRDDRGAKILVSGVPIAVNADESGNWLMSKDGGVTWGDLPFSGGGGSSAFFTEVDAGSSDYYVRFVLANGEEFFIPKYVAPKEISGPLDLTSRLSPPVDGGSPVSGFTGSSFTGIVTWTKRDGSGNFTVEVPLTEVFTLNAEYQAEVELKPLSGYSLPEKLQVIKVVHDNSVRLPGNGIDFVIEELRNDDDEVTGSIARGRILFRTSDSYTVSDLDLTGKISAPLNGARPQKSLDSGVQYSGEITWNNMSDEFFRLNREYTATITLTARQGFTFNGVKADAFRHDGAKDEGGVTNGAPAKGGEEITVTVKFKGTGQGTPVTGDGNVFDITAHIRRPVTGGSPGMSFSSGYYSATVTWWVIAAGGGETPMRNDGLFMAGTTYRAKVTLTPASGHYFPENGNGFRIKYEDRILPLVPDGGKLTGSVDFEKTDERKIDALNLTSLLSVPVAGYEAETRIESHQYEGVVTSWKTGAGSVLSEGDKFRFGTEYIATIKLTARQGYTFNSEVKANSFSHDGAGRVTNEAGSEGAGTLSVTVEFKAAAGTVTDWNLTGKIPTPMMWTAPVPNFSVPQYRSVSVEWDPEVSPENGFAAYKFYTATVRMKAEKGYTFIADSDNNPAEFSHSGGDIYPGETVLEEDGKAVTVKIHFQEAAIAEPTVFSGTRSAIDLIRDRKDDEILDFRLKATSASEQVALTNNTDFGTRGLELNADNSPAKVILDGAGLTVDLTGNPTGAPLITVGRGVTLLLQNITLKGLRSGDSGDNAGNSAPLVAVKDGGSLTLGTGAIIRDNDAEGSVGGISVERGGILIMSVGAEITGVAGGGGDFTPGGVEVSAGGTFTMNGGFIRNNKTRNDGAGVVLKGGQFIMNNGTVSDNRAENNGHSSGGGVILLESGSQFIMYGGTISGNTAEDQGGGVLVISGAFSMNGGEISGNTAGNQGGGVYGLGGTFNMDNGNIRDNTAGNQGGGVFMQGVFNMRHGNISGNRVKSGNGKGGGVYVGKDESAPEGGRFTLFDGTIVSNAIYPDGTGTAPTGKGAGVYVESRCTFIKNLGTIYGAGSSDNTKWEDTHLQNYCKWTINNPGLGGDHDVDYNDYDNVPGGRQGGYAVYYDCDNGGPRWYNNTLSGSRGLSTEFPDVTWEKSSD